MSVLSRSASNRPILNIDLSQFHHTQNSTRRTRMRELFGTLSEGDLLKGAKVIAGASAAEQLVDKGIATKVHGAGLSALLP